MIALLHWLIGSPRLSLSCSWRVTEILCRIRYYRRSFYRCTGCGQRWNGCWVGACYTAATGKNGEIEGVCRACGNQSRLDPI